MSFIFHHPILSAVLAGGLLALVVIGLALVFSGLCARASENHED